MLDRSPFKIGWHEINPGERRTIDLPVSVLSDHTPVNLSVHVVHGRRPGPVMFVSAAVHGDEIIGTEIVRRLLRTRHMHRVSGTLLAIPIVNNFGFMNHSRYLPDRRDLNRTFPGSAEGSLAARLANLFTNEILCRCDLGIDLHSAAIHRSNFPQIRVSPSKQRSLELAEVFGAPIILKSNVLEGSLRHTAEENDVDLLLFEAAGALRFDEFAARTGVTGVLRVMHHVGMLPKKGIAKPKAASLKARSSSWVRAKAGGLLRTFKTIGDHVSEGDVLGIISDPFGEVETEISAANAGLIIGRAELPAVNEGDALFHIARLSAKDDAETTIDNLTAQMDDDPIFDEDEII